MEKVFIFRGQRFTARITENFVYLYPPSGIETRTQLDCFTPTEEDLSTALGFKVEFVDFTGLVNEYAR